ncbi:unnamed protein product, partial [Brenthis ino]
MDEDSLNNSPSILAPESPDSPSLLLSPILPSWSRNENRPNNLVDDANEDQNTNNISSSIPIAVEIWRPNLAMDNSNIVQPHSSQSDGEISNPGTFLRNTVQSLNIQPWTPVIYDDDSNQSQSMQSESVPIHEESNSAASFADIRKEHEEPPAKVRKLSSPKRVADEGDGETCPICLDSWGNSGEHRLVSLKCGHLFGAHCVERWLKAQTSKDRSCPTCKSKANLKDIRFIYARKLVAADTSQLTALQKQIDILQAEKTRTELELQNSRIAHRTCVLQLEVLRNTLMKNQVSKDQQPKRLWRFALEKNLEISKDGGCRVLTYNCRTYEFYVSQKSTNNLFHGFGIRKVSSIDYKLGQFVLLHSKPIRDITYSQPRDLLLSVGLDSTARIVERGIPNTPIQCGVPLWSCSWDYLRSNEFYVGGVGGVIHQYDVRNSSSYIQRLNAPGDMSPVVSLCSTEYGLLSCQLNSCWLWVGNNRQWEPRALPVDGPFMSLCYDNESHRALLSSRGSSNERSRLTLCKLKSNVSSGETLFDIEQTFPGSARSTLMSRSTWVKTVGASWIASHSESESSLYLHGLDGGRTISLPAAEPALDVCCAQRTGDTILAALSESRLRLYKAVPTNS